MSYIPSITSLVRAVLLAGFMLTVTVLASQSFFPAFAQEAQNTDADDMRDYDENDDSPVRVYTATDPEEQNVTWSIVPASDDGPDADDFEMTNGVLTFKDSPDFEDPSDRAGGANTADDNTYVVQVRARTSVGPHHTITVTVNVQNVDEPGKVTFSSHPQPKEGTESSVMLKDDDRAIDSAGGLVTTANNTDLTNSASTTWQWYRSETGSDPWTEIEEMATSSSYTPVEADVGHYLRATAMYFDFEDTDEQRTAHGISAHKVLKREYINSPPMFRDADTTGSQITMSVPEDESLEEGDAVGQPITAEDIGEDGSQEVLTYTHGGDDSGSFTIDSASGQLKIAAGTTLDFETDPSYSVTVTASDPDGEDSTATVSINLTDEDEAPTITETGTTDTYDENDTRAVLTYNAADEDAGDGADGVALSWTLSGRDAADFSITTPTGGVGELTFKSPPNFEAAVDSNRDNIFNVTVEVADDAGNKDTRNVTVTIRNLDETADAPLTLTSHPQPEENRPVTVRLDEPDGVSGSVSWVWTLGGTPTTQSGGTTYSFTPRATGSLVVTATYTDRTNAQKTPSLTLTNVLSRPDPDTRPTFPDTETGARTIAENAADDAAANVGPAFEATDTDGSTLLYTLSGSDASAFTLTDRTSGQISVPAGQELDFERKSTYRFNITATDPTGGSHRALQPVTVTLTDVAEPPEITAGRTEIEYHENGSAAVETYRATDDENDAARPRVPLVWSLAGADSEVFRISQAGVLTFAASPNFEAAADDGTDSVYNVTVTVSDTDSTTSNATEEVTVMVINVDEDGEITGLPAQPKEKIEITVTLTDPDGPDTAGDSAGNDGDINTLTDNASTTWQWFRSRSRTSGWALISATSSANESVNTNTRTPEDADVGYYLRATAMYRDGEGDNKVTKPGVGVTVRTVQAKQYVNSAPEFRDDDDEAEGYQITMEVPEDNSVRRGDPVGGPIDDLVTDKGQNGSPEILTYTLTLAAGDGDAGDNQADFDIDRLTGQLRFSSTAGSDATPKLLDSENDDITGDQYQVRVKASDPSMASSTALVTIQIMPVEEAPEFIAEDDTTSPAVNLAATSTVENTATTTALSTYTATDDEDGTAALEWTLDGADKDRFALCAENVSGDTCTDLTAADATDNTVTLRFKDEPNYEAPADSGSNNVYNVTVAATDSDDGTSERDVTVTVTNMDEPGKVTLSHIQPEVGTSIRASLIDPDGGESGVTWEWLWCPTAECSATTTINATSDAYTPIAGDATRFLKAIATYTDRTSATGQDKRTASTTSIFAVQADDTGNQPPVLPDVTQTLEIDENSEDTDPVYVVGTVAATSDPDDELNSLLYALSGADAAFFTIHSGIDATPTGSATSSTAGMIRLKSGTELDYETKNTYRVTVTVTDPSLARDTVAVTINVTNVNEPPTVSQRGLTVTGPESVSYAEDRTDAVQTYRAVGPDASGASWSLSGADASAFSIVGGALSFITQPDFENAADANTDNVYNVTVMASMGDFDASQDVTVTVANVDEDGTVELTYDQNQVRVGVAITAEEPVDPDGGVTNVSWQWESSSDGSTGWSDIAGATSAAYTPVDGDVGNFLRATASYTDTQGSGKSASSDATPSAVLAASTAGTDGTVSLSASGSLVSGGTVTATLTDADNPTGLTWVWQTSSDGSTNWSAGAGSESSTGLTSTYTTTNADAGDYLRATVTYADDSGVGQTAESPASTGRVAIDGTYDRDSNGVIDAPEVLAAVADYFSNAISAQRVLQVVALYFSGLN